MGRICGDPIGSISQSPAVRLFQTTEVTPSGVGISAAVTPGIGDAFGPVEKALRETFLPALFEVLVEGALERGVTRLPVKHTVLDLPDPTRMSP